MQNPYLCIGFCGKLYPCPAEFVNIAAAIFIYMYARVRRAGLTLRKCGEEDVRRVKCGELRPVRKDGENVRVRLQQNTFMEHIRMLYIYY